LVHKLPLVFSHVSQPRQGLSRAARARREGRWLERPTLKVDGWLEFFTM
jgi:hypothetical protein